MTAVLALLVRFDVRPGHLAAFDALVARTITGITEHEPGTLAYTSHARRDHPDDRVFYECYRDHDAFLAHEATSHTRQFLAERGQHLSGAPEVWWLTPLGEQSGEGLQR